MSQYTCPGCGMTTPNTKPTEPIDELLQKLEYIQYKFGYGNIANKKIVSLIAADRKQLLDKFEEIVRENSDSGINYEGSGWYSVMVALAKPRKEYLGDK